MQKPPFKPLMMRDVLESEGTNGYNAVSTFSGAGGSSLGLKLAGFKVLWANEFIPAAQKVYEQNHRNTYLDKRDIRTIKTSEILANSQLDIGEIDLLEGSPPCASFSTCGRLNKDWGKVKAYSSTEQRVDDLFFEYIRILRGLKPKVFIAENVKGLITGVGKGYFKWVLEELKKSGYRVKVKLLNAAMLGVPQKRERVIFIGVREDLNVDPVFPTPLKYYYTIRDAIPNFTKRKKLPKNDLCWELSPGKMMVLWRNSNPKVSYGHWSGVHYRLFGKEGMWNHRTADPDRPAYTIVQGSTSLYHPKYPRSLSISELKRIFTFPDDFRLSGNFYQQWERIGRSVPPMMMYHIANTIRTEILDKVVGGNIMSVPTEYAETETLVKDSKTEDDLSRDECEE